MTVVLQNIKEDFNLLAIYDANRGSYKHEHSYVIILITKYIHAHVSFQHIVISYFNELHENIQQFFYK